MRKIILSLAIIASLASCSKQDPRIENFEKVKLIQSGEYVELYGFLPAANKDPHRYIVEVNECGVKKTYTIDIAPGSLTGWSDFQTNCKIGTDWKIVYDDILRQ